MTEQSINKIEYEIIATLAFFNMFKKALTIDEISELLIKTTNKTNIITKTELEKNILSLEKKKLISGIQNMGRVAFYIKGQKCEDHSEINNALLKKALKYSWIFTKIPFIKMVAICNTLSFKSAKKDSDIDLFIITRKNRLFITRFLLIIITHLLRIRRHGNYISGRYCLSFLVDETAMDIYKLANQKDIYFRYWLKTLNPIYSTPNFIKIFNEKNYQWLNQKLYNPIIKTNTLSKKQISIIKFIEIILNGKLGNIFENKLKKTQINRARKKAVKLTSKSGTIISDHILKFHDNDKREELQKKWENIINNI